MINVYTIMAYNNFRHIGFRESSRIYWQTNMLEDMRVDRYWIFTYFLPIECRVFAKNLLKNKLLKDRYIDASNVLQNFIAYWVQGIIWKSLLKNYPFVSINSKKCLIGMDPLEQCQSLSGLCLWIIVIMVLRWGNVGLLHGHRPRLQCGQGRLRHHSAHHSPQPVGARVPSLNKEMEDVILEVSIYHS